MAKIAVDIVIFPIEEIVEKAIEINTQLRKAEPDNIILSRDDCRVHISLAMGCVENGKIAQISEILASIAGKCPKKLIISGLGILSGSSDQNATKECRKKLKGAEYNNAFGAKKRVVSGFFIEKCADFLNFHEEIMKKTSVFMTFDADFETIFTKENDPQLI